MKFSSIIILSLLLFNILFSQFHKEEKEYFEKKYSEIDDLNTINYPQIQKGNIELNKSVFGFLPFWELSNADFLRYNLLTHIALFDFYVDARGDVDFPFNWFYKKEDWKKVIANAQLAGVKVLMTAVNFDKDDIRTILIDDEIKNNFFNNIVDIINEYNLDGIIIDFEGPYVDDRGQLMNDFVADLNFVIKQNAGQATIIAFATPSINWGGWDFEGLADQCDFLFIMAYDYFGSWSTLSGPTSPLWGGNPTSFEDLNVTSTLEIDYRYLVNNNPEKIILGLPYYGIHFYTKDPLPNSEVLGVAERAPRYHESISVYNQNRKIWPPDFGVPYTDWLDSVWNQYWIDDDSSLGMKFDLVNDKDLLGVGIWALGYDGSRPELWELIEEKFSSTITDAKNENELPDKFILYQNYPNPFNPATSIKYQVASEMFISIIVYDALGNEIKVLLNEVKPPGLHEAKLNSDGLTSGVYFYQLKAGNKISTKKMVLMK